MSSFSIYDYFDEITQREGRLADSNVKVRVKSKSKSNETGLDIANIKMSIASPMFGEHLFERSS